MKLSTKATGLALSGTLVSVFVICLLVQMIFPNLQATHMWIDLFTNAPAGSTDIWVQGILVNAVSGYIAGVIFAKIYNSVER